MGKVSISEIYATIRGTLGVDYVEEVQLFPVKEGERQEAISRISIPPDSLPLSYKKEVILGQELAQTLKSILT